MNVILYASRKALRCNVVSASCALVWKSSHTAALFDHRQRCFHSHGWRLAQGGAASVADTEYWQEFKGTYNVSRPTFRFDDQISLALIDTKTTAVGFLKKIVRLSDALCFAHLGKGAGPEYVQILFRGPEMIKNLEDIRLNSAISVTGTLKSKRKPKNPATAKPPVIDADEGSIFLDQIEIAAENVTCLNTFAKEIAYGPQHVYSPTSRHLQIRFDEELRKALLFRSEVTKFARQELRDFHEIETPILFKSTPEGAREFLVPTRRPGFAYALPQSPQQYKQMLMASGIDKYVQFARCFRDEDLRADRQPEFTQIDLEMAWTDGEGVMQRVENFIKSLYEKFNKPVSALLPLPDAPFYRMSYDEALSQHGSDKPDLRIPGLIHRVDHIVPQQLSGMITHLKNPIIEAFKIRLEVGPDTIQKFLRDFFASSEGELFEKNPDGGPGISIYDPRKPLEGLRAFGFEGAEAIKDFYSSVSKHEVEAESNHEVLSTFEEGDLLLLQARPNLPHSGGSTALGNLRRALYKAATSQNLLRKSLNHHYLWITDFPMFTLENDVDPGQGGSAGFSATHHPFTAPKTSADVDLLLNDPLKAKADHYDLVVNGVELGGGSRRIHSAEMQRFVMRDVLKMTPERIGDFEHLLRALSAGCPPHAGLAIGFDRLIAVMCGTESVRDVIAFPKNSKGDDLMVGSPRQVDKEELSRYHLEVISVAADNRAVGEGKGGVETQIEEGSEFGRQERAESQEK